MPASIGVEYKGGTYTVLVDEEDVPRLEGWTITFVPSSGGKLYPKIKRQEGPISMTALLSRFLINCPIGREVDHEDGDVLNNTKKNLRPCTRSQNQYNTKVYKHKHNSRFKGVRWFENRKCWYAAIQYKNARIHLGEYKDEEEAAIAYDTAARKIAREFARLNFPQDKRRIYYTPKGKTERKDSLNALRAEIYALPDYEHHATSTASSRRCKVQT